MRFDPKGEGRLNPKGIIHPRYLRNELPWVVLGRVNPERVAAIYGKAYRGFNPFGFSFFARRTQGSSFLRCLG